MAEIILLSIRFLRCLYLYLTIAGPEKTELSAAGAAARTPNEPDINEDFYCSTLLCSRSLSRRPLPCFATLRSGGASKCSCWQGVR